MRRREPQVRTTIAADEQLLARLRGIAQTRGVKLGEMVDEAIGAYVHGYEREHGPCEAAGTRTYSRKSEPCSAD